MAADFSYDPVTAIDEATASGETAAIFADIRQTMEIPLVTSIWRGLAGMDDGLSCVWTLAKPLYQTGLPAQALARLIKRADLPLPEPLAPTQLACIGIGPSELATIQSIIAAYNRSNGMNLVALAALIVPPAEGRAESATSKPPVWPNFPPLMARPAIAEDTWTMIRHVNAIGSLSLDAQVATLWRHLAHWPHLLALVYAAFAPLQASGAIGAATDRVVRLALEEGAYLAKLRPDAITLPQLTRDTITDYVSTPTQVVRMVTLGHVLARWLAAPTA